MVECPSGYNVQSCAQILKSDGKVYFWLLRQGDEKPPDVIDLEVSNLPSALDSLLLAQAYQGIRHENPEQNDGNVTADAGFPKGDPGYEAGFLPDTQSWEMNAHYVPSKVL